MYWLYLFRKRKIEKFKLKIYKNCLRNYRDTLYNEMKANVKKMEDRGDTQPYILLYLNHIYEESKCCIGSWDSEETINNLLKREKFFL